jgi:hypothetical protein
MMAILERLAHSAERLAQVMAYELFPSDESRVPRPIVFSPSSTIAHLFLHFMNDNERSYAVLNDF